MKPTLQQLAVLWFLLYLACAQNLTNPSGKVYPDTASSGILFQARQILSNLRSTQYSHRPMVDAKTGTYRLDCSALAEYLIRFSSAQALTMVAADAGHRRRAKNFYDTIANAPLIQYSSGWQIIPSLLSARPGDFIVWRKNPMPPKGDTGHILMVMQKPVRESQTRVRVAVLDASRSGHAHDTRKPGDSGVGTGTMWFRVDGHGAPVAVYWSNPLASPKVYTTVIGRVVEAP